MRALVLVVVLAGMLTGGCGDAEREPNERRNLAALRTIPLPPGSVTAGTETFGEHAPDTSEGPIVGWTTIRYVRLPRAEKSATVVARSRRALQGAGWRVEDGAGFYLNARRGPTCLHLLTEPDAPPTATVDEEPAAASERMVRGLLLKVVDC